jgi:Uma2 family endonuclease
MCYNKSIEGGFQMPIPEKSYHDYFTYTQYKNWPDNERWELVEGQAFDMSPAPGMTHQNISLELSRQIANYLQGKPCKVFTTPFDVILRPTD